MDPDETQRVVGTVMMAKKLLIVSALLEAATGLTLLISPLFVSGLLLGVPLDRPAALVVGRIAGAALLALGVACWQARDDGPSGALRGLVLAMLLYNFAAVAVLATAGASVGLAGVLMWPTVVLHAALGVWSTVCLRSGLMNAAGTGEIAIVK